MSRASLRQVGTTVGLARDCRRPDRPEQVYVWLDEEDSDRPVLIEGWVGYDIPMRMRLTVRQARELLPALLVAVALRPEVLA